MAANAWLAEVQSRLILPHMYAVLSLVAAFMSGSVVEPPRVVADAQRKCVEAAKGPAQSPFARLPVDKFDECIAAEANKRPMRVREAICALGKSGGASGSSVEVYMSHGKCRTDYE